MPIVAVAVQSEFTLPDPLSTSCAEAPATVLVCVPETFPSASRVYLPTAATGTGPKGRSSIPVYVYPQLPATLAIVQVDACAGGARVARNIAKERIVKVASAPLRLMVVLLIEFCDARPQCFEKLGSSLTASWHRMWPCCLGPFEWPRFQLHRQRFRN